MRRERVNAGKLRRPTAVLLLVGVLVVVGEMSGSPPVSASGQYFGGASAQGMRATFTVPNYLVVTTLADAGVPSAQAEVDSLGNSDGFASAPYPGATAISLPPTLNGQANGQYVPNYPFYVASSYPSSSPHESLAAPGYDLSSQSTATNTTADASGGVSASMGSPGQAQSYASVTADPEAGSVKSSSRSVVDLITINGVLTVKGIVSTASAQVGPSNVVTVRSTLVIGGATVAGQQVSIGPGGLELPGSSVPLPADSPLMDALRQAKVSVAYLNPVPENDGIISAGLEVSAEQPIPDSNANGTASYIFGEAEAHAGSSYVSSQSTSNHGPAGTPVPTGANTAPVPPATSSVGSAQSPSPVGSITPRTTLTPPTSPVPSGQGATSQEPVSQPLARLSPDRTSVVSARGTLAIYLLLALAASVIFIGATLTRYIGVRMPWDS